MNFNPRTPVGCDIVGDDVVPDALISIHAPQWGATRGRWRRSNAIRFQSTHPSGVRQPFLPRVKMHVEISIHAPQWGATIPQDYINRYGRISIHAPQWGATRNGVSDAAYRCYFNPRTPVGCDDRRQGEHHRPGISIHAPQWSATCPSSSLLVLVIVFQSTHPSGVRRAPITKVRQARYFNPRTPVGCDRPERASLRRRTDFNPRTPVGCDPPKWGQGRATCRISIHAPQWGATVPARRGPRPRTISIHAPQWGATRVSGRVRRTAYFNPRTPVGCDRATHGSKTSDKISIHAPQWGATLILSPVGHARTFQSTHPSGVRLVRSASLLCQSHFNPRTPVGCDRASGMMRLGGADFNPRTPVGCD